MTIPKKERKINPKQFKGKLLSVEELSECFKGLGSLMLSRLESLLLYSNQDMRKTRLQKIVIPVIFIDASTVGLRNGRLEIGKKLSCLAIQSKLLELLDLDRPKIPELVKPDVVDALPLDTLQQYKSITTKDVNVALSETTINDAHHG